MTYARPDGKKGNFAQQGGTSVFVVTEPLTFDGLRGGERTVVVVNAPGKAEVVDSVRVAPPGARWRRLARSRHQPTLGKAEDRPLRLERPGPAAATRRDAGRRRDHPHRQSGSHSDPARGPAARRQVGGGLRSPSRRAGRAGPRRPDGGASDEVDARALDAYDLPPRVEHRLLEGFRGAARPVAHRWRHWNYNYPMPGLTLAERMSESGRAHPRGPWVLDVFRPLPEDKAKLWCDYEV